MRQKVSDKFRSFVQVINLAEINVSGVLIGKMISILVVWLHVKVGVSRSVANKLLQALQLILTTFLQLLEAALLSFGITMKLSDLKIPHDVRTAYQLHFTEPDIIRTACCPKCFSLIPRPIPWQCQWRASPRSRPCNAELWKTQNTRSGPKMVPRSLYTTQSFDSWLKTFLSRKIIEDGLKETFCQYINNPPTAFGGTMKDIHDSPAWKNLQAYLLSPYHLVFGIYVYWFNPFTNKIAGKIMQILLICID